MTHADRDFDTWLRTANAAYDQAVAETIDVEPGLAEVTARAGEHRSGTTPSIAEPRIRQERLEGWTRLGILVLAGALLFAFATPQAAIIYTYLGAPLLLVHWWFQASRAEHRWIMRRRPRDVSQWTRQVLHSGRVLRVQARWLRELRRSIGEARLDTAELRELCAAPALRDVAQELTDIERHLGAARSYAKTLSRLMRSSGDSAVSFAGAARSDLRAACFDFGGLFIAVDPDRVGDLVRSLALQLKPARDIATNMPVRFAQLAPAYVDLIDATHTQELAADIVVELQELFSEVQAASPAVRRSCRYMLEDANDLHGAVTAALVGGLKFSTTAKALTRIALRLSPYTRSRTKRSAVRTVFLNEVTRPDDPTRAQVGRATASAVSRGRTWTPTP